MRRYPTQYQKRKLIYENPERPWNITLQLPLQYRSKISHGQHKKIKQAFYIQTNIINNNNTNTSSQQQKQQKQPQIPTLSRLQFVNVLRSLSIVSKTVPLYEEFDNFNKDKITWEQFLKVYLVFRTQKGSYNQLNNALSQLGKQYRGDWEYLENDLITIGDVLTKEDVDIFYKQILGKKNINHQNILNSLLGYK